MHVCVSVSLCVHCVRVTAIKIGGGQEKKKYPRCHREGNVVEEGEMELSAVGLNLFFPLAL